MNFNFETILPASELGKRIAKIAKVGESLQLEIHEVAVQTLAHIAAHGDYVLSLRLLNALPSGQRRQALAAWFRNFSGNQFSATLDKDTGSWVGKLAKGWTVEAFDMDGAERTSYGDFLPEKGYTTFTMESFLALIKRRANEDGLNPNGTPKVEPQVREFCADLYARMAAPKAKANVIPLAALIVDNS
jgi:hypothetical protein